MTISVVERKSRNVPDRAHGMLCLPAERDWLVEGPAESLREVQAAIPRFCEPLTATVMIMRFGNALGRFDAGPLGRLNVVSGRWVEADFERLLADITARMALLPFTSETGGKLEVEKTHEVDERLLYHAFCYLRHIFSDLAQPQDRVVPALELVTRQPHRRVERAHAWTPLPVVQRVEPRGLLAVLQPRAELVRTHHRGAVARHLGGHLPQYVEEARIQSTVDTPENRFVKGFLGHAIALVERMESLAKGKGGMFESRVVDDCRAIARAMAPTQQHPLWADVSAMKRLPVESQVLQRRRGYRDVLRHHVRLRLAPRLPLRSEQIRELLEIKNIAELYELWCFFEVERQVSLALQRPAVHASSFAHDDLDLHAPWGMRVSWTGGIELFYNLTYSRSAANRSYSLRLRPDIVLRIPDGPCSGDHLFDAKFKLEQFTTDSENDQGNVVSGKVKQGDLHKMHTYRDALHKARSVWVLYPGSVFRFFDVQRGLIEGVAKLDAPLQGVGAIPLRPAGDDLGVARVVEVIADGLVSQGRSARAASVAREIFENKPDDG